MKKGKSLTTIKQLIFFRSVLTILFLLTFLQSYSQSKFQIAIGGSSGIGDFCPSIIQTSDGGYALGGYNNFIGYADAYIVKLNSIGALQWTRTLHKNGTPYAVKSIAQTTDGGYVMAISNTTGLFCTFGKLNSLGEPQWIKMAGGIGFSYSIVQSLDGGYTLAGYTNSYGAGGNDVFVVKLDSNVNVQWTRTVGGSGDDRGNLVIRTSDGGYAVAGFTSSFGAGNTDFYIVKLDSSGVLQWTRTVGGNGNDEGYSIVQTTDGGYAVAGFTNSFGAGSSDLYIIKLDNSGVLQWTRTVGGSGDDRGYSIVQTTDGGYAVAGNTNSFGAGNTDFYIVKLDNSSALQWTRTAGGSSADQGYSIVHTTDGGYAVAGYTNSFGAGGYDIYMVKLDSIGNFCNNTSSGGNAGSGGVSGSGGTSGLGVSTVQPQTWVSGTLGILTNICSLVSISGSETSTPNSFKLFQNYPNPFNPSTSIKFDIPKASFVKLAVYDVSGNEVAVLINDIKKAGTYSAEFDGSSLSSGVYFYKLITSDFTETKRMILLK